MELESPTFATTAIGCRGQKRECAKAMVPGVNNPLSAGKKVNYLGLNKFLAYTFLEISGSKKLECKSEKMFKKNETFFRIKSCDESIDVVSEAILL